MTSTLRAQAAKAAMKWAETHGSTVCKDYDGQIACAAGYLLGHAAGVEEGARRFAEMEKERNRAKYDRDVEKTVNRQLVELCRELATGKNDDEERLASIIGMDGRWD